MRVTRLDPVTQCGPTVVGLALWFFASGVAASPVVVGDAATLRDALTGAEAGDVIEVLPGDYLLSGMRLALSEGTSGAVEVRASVPGTARLWTQSGTLFDIRAGQWHFSGLDFQGSHSAGHAIYLNGGGSRSRIEGNRFQNFHAAIRSAGRGSSPSFPDDVLVARNVFVNDTPRDTRQPVAAVDAVGGSGWRITENFFADIALAPRGSGRPGMAAAVRGGASDAVLDRNLVICEWRHAGGQRLGLSLGGEGTRRASMDPRTTADCNGACPETRSGRLYNNLILNCPDGPGIYLNRAQQSRIANNTIFDAFGIQARFAETSAEAVDNLLSGTIREQEDARVEAVNNVETGRWDTLARLPGLKRRLELPVPDHRILYAEWLDRLVRGSVERAHAWVDSLAGSSLGKGLRDFDDWFVFPRAVDFRLQDGERIVAQGVSPPVVSADFCGQARSAPADRGAIEYKAGECRLGPELERRYGPLLSAFEGLEDSPPPDWSEDRSLPAAAVDLPVPVRVLHADPDSFRQVVADLEPGDWLRLEPGEYTHSLSLRGIRGTAERPIVISGPSSGDPAVFLGRRGANTIRLRNAAHIVIRHLELDGGGHNIAGVVAEPEGRYAHDITLEYLTIRNYDGSQGNSGITTRTPAWNWVIRNNDIRNVGTGMYLGRPDGYGPFIGGLVENNFIAGTLGYNVQIKHQNVRDRLPHMPTEPRQTILRYNVFSKAEGGADGDRARPNLLVGHLPTQGPGQHDRYLIYGNLFYQNPHERLFQGEGNLALYNNLFVNHHGDGLIVRRHNDVPKEVKILNNTVVAEGFGIAIVHPDRDSRQVVAGNAVFAGEPLQVPRRIDAAANLTGSRAEAGAKLMSPDAALAELDLFPRGQELRRERTLPEIEGLWHFDRDYSGREREGSFWGAYASPHAINVGREPGIGPAAANCAPCQ